MDKKTKARDIISKLSTYYTNPKSSLNFTTPLELLIATMLSAQTTDKLVNQITPFLFSKYLNVEDFAKADYEELDKIINKVNFHRNKAKSIISASKMIVEKYSSNVPDTMEALITLPGVARKTANVVLGNAYQKAEGIAVDTHVVRLSKKLGLTDNSDPIKIEKDLMNLIPRKNWISFSHMLILFGREFCPARPHTCPDCPLKDLCPDLTNG